MRAPVHLARRFFAVGVAAILVAPLLGAMQHHPVDHDGVTHHIEAAHGGHAPVMVEWDDRLTATGVKVPGMPGPSQGPSLDSPRTIGALSDLPETTFTPARAPPKTQQPRGPPHLI